MERNACTFMWHQMTFWYETTSELPALPLFLIWLFVATHMSYSFGVEIALVHSLCKFQFHHWLSIHVIPKSYTILEFWSALLGKKTYITAYYTHATIKCKPCKFLSSAFLEFSPPYCLKLACGRRDFCQHFGQYHITFVRLYLDSLACCHALGSSGSLSMNWTIVNVIQESKISFEANLLV